jgi:hypothetical protein
MNVRYNCHLTVVEFYIEKNLTKTNKFDNNVCSKISVGKLIAFVSINAAQLSKIIFLANNA